MVDVPDKVQQAQAERSSVGAHRRVSRGIGQVTRANASVIPASHVAQTFLLVMHRLFFSRPSMYSLYSGPGRTPSLSEDDQTANEFVCWRSGESSYVR